MATTAYSLLIVGTVMALVAAPAAMATPEAVADEGGVAIQTGEDVEGILDRIADILAELNRVMSELSQLFGEGEEGGEGDD